MNAMTSQTMLDADELKHLALKAIEADQNDAAISFVKRALALSPEDAELHYMLGAVHAEIGMMKRATEEISHAVALDPHLHTANFQLGLLHLTNGDFEQAQTAWEPLAEMEDDHPLRVFATGLVHLGNDEFEACINALERGIAVCGNDSLNNDMRRVIQEANAALAAQGTGNGSSASSAKAVATAQQASQHVLLAGYQATSAATPAKAN